MSKLDDTVRDVVLAFVRDEVLFTALDVSNKVKETVPYARHRDVRDVVRNLFVSDVEPSGWAKTPIEVSLNDGTKAEALLYHPLSASWDLDNQYDIQKRAQSSIRPQGVVGATGPTCNAGVPMPATVAADGTVTVTNPLVPTVPVIPSNSRQLWDQLFGMQPSLFPRKQ